MSDLTNAFNEHLKSRQTHCAIHPLTAASTTDEFLKEAYRITDHVTSLRSYLLSIRQVYLSTASAPPRHSKNPQPLQAPTSQQKQIQRQIPTFLTNSARDAIDTDAKTLLRDLSYSLRQLSSAESLRRQTWQQVHERKYRRGFLGRWAAGGGPTATSATGLDDDEGKSEEQRAEEGQEETLAAVREGVLWFLARRMEAVAEVQRDMVERRVRREVERGRSVLYLSKPSATGGTAAAAAAASGGSTSSTILLDEEEKEERRRRQQEQNHQRRQGRPSADADEAAAALSPDQLQLLASENNDLLQHYTTNLSQLRAAESSILEISSLQTQLVDALSIQSSHISQLVTDSVNTTENIGMGNKQLRRAAERRSVARMVFWASVVLCGSLVGWDLIF